MAWVVPSHLIVLFQLQSHLQEVFLKLFTPEALIILMVVNLLVLSGNFRVLFWRQWSSTGSHAKTPPKTSDKAAVLVLLWTSTYAVGFPDVIRQHIVHPPLTVREVWALLLLQWVVTRKIFHGLRNKTEIKDKQLQFNLKLGNSDHRWRFMTCITCKFAGWHW